MKTNATTHNNANAYEHSENPYLEFFSKAGAMFEKRKKYYQDKNNKAIDLFKDAWRAGDKKLCMQMLMFLRDCRDGQGNRSSFRSILNWLALNYPEWVISNIELIPKIGRWDDLVCLYDTAVESHALNLWKNGLLNKETSGLAAKWANRKDNKFRKFLSMSPKDYRKMLVSKTNVVETKMCNKEWSDINYNQVPSVASTRYVNAFNRHDNDRYNEWKKSLSDKSSGSKVNTGAIYPHDLIRSALNVTDDIHNLNCLLERQLEDMKNYIPDDQRIMCICDFSHSMTVQVSGSITAKDVCLGLGLYCSEKVGKNNPFYRKLIPFSSNSKLESWKDMTFLSAVSKIPNGYVGTTNIHSAFNVLLDAAKFFNATRDQMPTTILILSDMQFDNGCSDRTPVEECIDKWISMGYDKPKIVYWNLNAYENQPSTYLDKDVCLVSGYSPSVLKSVLACEDLSPMAILRKSVENYNIIEP
jgi:hypothetical protein